jgi:protein-L-isoaspartate(D-aspartate) O-methyltransferase
MAVALERSGAVRTPAVREAFLAVPRELFVEEVAARDGIAAVYRPERVLVTATDARGVPISSSSAPDIMAPMLEMLRLEPGLRVLEIGAGTGYNAALLKRLVGDRGRVTTVDVDAAFARRARHALAEGGFRCRVVAGDGRAGWPKAAPFDRIIATASSDHVPRAWRDQVVPGGLIVLPLRLVGSPMPQLVMSFQRDGDVLRSTAITPGSFMPLRDAGGSGETAATEPALSATERGRPHTVFAWLEGDYIASLSRPARQRTLATILGEGRRIRSLPMAAARGLNMFLALSDISSLVRCTIHGRQGVAILDPSGRSVAAVTAGRGKPGRIDAWGDERGEQRLATLVNRWERMRSPTIDDLRLTIRYSRSTPDNAWRTRRTADSVISIDWTA